MSSTSTIPPHVRITSGLCMGSSDPKAIGRWLHFVTYADEDGAELGDYVGPSLAKAGRAAIDLARSFSCRIVDRGVESVEAAATWLRSGDRSAVPDEELCVRFDLTAEEAAGTS